MASVKNITITMGVQKDTDWLELRSRLIAIKGLAESILFETRGEDKQEEITMMSRTMGRIEDVFYEGTRVQENKQEKPKENPKHIQLDKTAKYMCRNALDTLWQNDVIEGGC